METRENGNRATYGVGMSPHREILRYIMAQKGKKAKTGRMARELGLVSKDVTAACLDLVGWGKLDAVKAGVTYTWYAPGQVARGITVME